MPNVIGAFGKKENPKPNWVLNPHFVLPNAFVDPNNIWKNNIGKSA
jgi:hypothetical protein